MSSLRLALKQSLQDAPGGGPQAEVPGGKKRRKKKLSSIITKRGARPGEPPKIKRKRGRPRKYPRPEDLLLMQQQQQQQQQEQQQQQQGELGSSSAAAMGMAGDGEDHHQRTRGHEDGGDSSSENEFSYDDEDEEESDSEEEDGEEDEEEEEEDDDDNTMGSEGEVKGDHVSPHKSSSHNPGVAHASSAESHDQHARGPSSGEAAAGGDASTAHHEQRKQHKLMKKKLKHSAANKIQSHWKKKKNYPDAQEGAAPAASKPYEESDTAQKGDASASGPRANDDDGEAPVVKKKKKKQNGVVPPPTPDVLEWAHSMSEKKCRKHIVPGLRVKVRFSTKAKRDGKLVKKKIWYGGKVAAVSKKGSKIKIKYDDGTSEIARFPEKDVVVDAVMNGEHEIPADRFLPPEGYEMGQGGSEDELDAEAKPEAKPSKEDPRSSPTQHAQESSNISTAPADQANPDSTSLQATSPGQDTAGGVEPKQQPKTPVNETTGAPESSNTPGIRLMASAEEGEISPGITTHRKEVTDVPPMESMPSPQGESTAMSVEPVSNADAGTAEPASSATDPAEEETFGAGHTTKLAIRIPARTSATGIASPKATAATEPEVKSVDDILVDTPVADDKLKRKRDDADGTEDEPPTRKLKVLENDAAEAAAKPVPGARKETEPDSGEATLPQQSADDSAPAEEAKRPSITLRLPQHQDSEITEMDLAPPQHSEKKKKKKDRAKSPRPRSPMPKLEEQGPQDGSATETVGKKATKSRILAEVDSSLVVGEDLNQPSLTSQPSMDSFGSASRGGRKAAQEAKEKLNTKDKEKQAPAALDGGKKKKKKRKHEDVEGGEAEETVKDLSKDFQWVQCDACKRWRAIPSSVNELSLPKNWYCHMNTFDPKRNTCEAPEQNEKQVIKDLKRAKKKARRIELEAQQQMESKKEKQQVADSAAVSPKPAKAVKAGEKVKDHGDAKKKTVAEDQRPPSDPGLADSHKEDKKKGKKAKPQEVADVPEQKEPAPEPKKPGRKRGRPARNQTTPTPQPRESQDEDNVEWVQCEKCEKWRKLPPDISADELPDKWYCSMNTWNPAVASCDAAEDKTDAHHHEVGSSEWQLRQTHAGKYSYRQMIFGAGAKKQNRPMSERSRAAESLFVKPVSDDDESPIPTTQYSKCSSFLPRTSNFHRANAADDKSVGIFDVLSNSMLWAELRAMEQAQPMKVGSSSEVTSRFPKFVTYENLPAEIKMAMQEVMLQILGSSALSGDVVIRAAQQYPWEQKAMLAYCNADVVINALLALVRDGIVEMTTTRDRSIPMSQWTPLYRRVRSKRALAAEEQIKASKCMKIAKPWKQRAAEDTTTEWISGQAAFS